MKLSGDCGEMGGTFGPVADNPLTGIVKLDPAFVDGIEVDLGGGYSAVVDLEWTAIGDVYKQRFSEPGMRASHRTRDADVALGGTVTIKDGSTIVQMFGTGDLYWSIITHYNEIQNSNLP